MTKYWRRWASGGCYLVEAMAAGQAYTAAQCSCSGGGGGGVGVVGATAQRLEANCAPIIRRMLHGLQYLVQRHFERNR